MKNKKIVFGIILILMIVIAIAGMILKNNQHEKRQKKHLTKWKRN